MACHRHCAGQGDQDGGHAPPGAGEADAAPAAVADGGATPKRRNITLWALQLPPLESRLQRRRPLLPMSWHWLQAHSGSAAHRLCSRTAAWPSASALSDQLWAMVIAFERGANCTNSRGCLPGCDEEPEHRENTRQESDTAYVPLPVPRQRDLTPMGSRDAGAERSIVTGTAGCAAAAGPHSSHRRQSRGVVLPGLHIC